LATIRSGKTFLKTLSSSAIAAQNLNNIIAGKLFEKKILFGMILKKHL